MSKTKIACGIVFALTIAASAATAQNVAELVMTPGKGVSFYMGSKHGITTFMPENGLCSLTIAVGDNPDSEGANPTTSTKMVSPVPPGQTARLETTEGKVLLFTCGPGANVMGLVMPPEVKFTQSK
jgi:hypothetical protein